MKKNKKFEQYKQEIAGWEDVLIQNSFDEKLRFIFEEGGKRFECTVDDLDLIIKKATTLIWLSAVATAMCGAFSLVYAQFIVPFMYSWMVMGVLLYGMRGRPYHNSGAQPKKWMRDKYQNHDMRRVYAEEIQMLHIKICHNTEINRDRYRYIKIGAILLWSIPAVAIISFIAA